MKTRNSLLFAGTVAAITGLVGVAPAQAQAADASQASLSIVKAASTTPPTSDLTLDDLEAEIAALEGLSEDELKAVMEASVSAHQSRGSGELETAALPAVPLIVWGIGCGVAGISSVATDSWSNANSAAWAIAGILVGCIPGVTQANIVKVILANKGTIANALKAVGLTAPAFALTGDSAT